MVKDVSAAALGQLISSSFTAIGSDCHRPCENKFWKFLFFAAASDLVIMQTHTAAHHQGASFLFICIYSQCSAKCVHKKLSQGVFKSFSARVPLCKTKEDNKIRSTDENPPQFFIV